MVNSFEAGCKSSSSMFILVYLEIFSLSLLAPSVEGIVKCAVEVRKFNLPLYRYQKILHLCSPIYTKKKPNRGLAESVASFDSRNRQISKNRRGVSLVICARPVRGVRLISLSKAFGDA